MVRREIMFYGVRHTFKGIFLFVFVTFMCLACALFSQTNFVARAISSSDLTSADDGDTVTLDGDLALSSTFVVDKALTIDLGGFVLSCTEGSVIEVAEGGELTICDSVLNGGKVTSGTGTNINGTTCGGGILVRNGAKLTIEGGVISSNSAQMGGGVYVESGGTFTMIGGSIAGNYQNIEYGGGVYVEDGGTFTISGGNISGNYVSEKGGGVYMAGTFNASGTPYIGENEIITTFDVNNLYLEDGKIINVVGEFEVRNSADGIPTRIGVSLESYAIGKEITANFALYNTKTTGDVADPEDFFSFDSDNLIGLMSSGEVGEVEGMVDDPVIPIANTRMVIITPNGGEYGGTITPATAVFEDTTVPDSVKIILTYYGTANDGSEYLPSTTPPTLAGTYTVSASIDESTNIGLDMIETYATFVIERAKISYPRGATSARRYSDNSVICTYSIDEEGNDVVTFSISDKNNYEWSNGSQDDVSYTVQSSAQILDENVSWWVWVLVALLGAVLLVGVIILLYWFALKRNKA
jgi:hypothetical protein